MFVSGFNKYLLRINMKALFCLVFLSLFNAAYPIEGSDSLNTKKFKAGATFSINSNGIASIPAFSLDKPAVMASLFLGKNRFSYEPTLAYGSGSEALVHRQLAEL